MSDQIICVKIAQRILDASVERREYSKFPFDRVYLGKKTLKPQFRKLFRYYMCLTPDRPLLRALGRLQVKKIQATHILRNDTARYGIKAVPQRNYFLDHIKEMDDWVMVIPTHVRTVYRKPEVFKEPHKSELMYIMSKAIDFNHNGGVQLPPITLVTPTRTIPILCGVCRRLLEMHAGNCMPGQPQCSYHAAINLAYDDHNSRTPQQSVDASGDY